MLSNELLIISILIFLTALLGVYSLYSVFFSGRRQARAINHRLALTQRGSNPADVLEALRRERGVGMLAQIPMLQKSNELLVQTGLRISPTLLLVWVLALTIIIYTPLKLFFFVGVIGLAPVTLFALAVVYTYLRIVRRRRIGRFGEQLPEALDVVVRGLRAGHPFRVALSLVAREMPDPVGSEFGILLDEITFGLDQTVAVDNLNKRVGLEDLVFFSIAINLQSHTGGNLAEILGRLSKLLRERAKVRMKIRVLTSEGRLSAVFLSLTPFVLFGIISFLAPTYFGAVQNHPSVAPALVIGSALLLLGNIVMYRMVNFKF